MKLIIDVPEEYYKSAKLMVEKGSTYPLKVSIANGTPLDDVKAEMERANKMYPYTNHGILEAIDILDKYIGKAESEGD